ncbi:unnamed protein product [Hermetia illucens]|uniref:Uncharacterized protein n=1 Tax=Hermetia illucens TaxID=343691 RepID=A0A7R8YWK5_HERIL|nr:unnamed protein product [Hermetia illucens]
MDGSMTQSEHIVQDLAQEDPAVLQDFTEEHVTQLTQDDPSVTQDVINKRVVQSEHATQDELLENLNINPDEEFLDRHFRETKFIYKDF